MINVIKNIKKVFFVIMWLFCLVYARNSSERIIHMDISVYNGEGSILLNWAIPDSIKVKNTIIYSQKFGNEEFVEIATLPSKTFFFLDTNCEPGERYFYKIVIQDIYDKFFSGDLENLPFGSCNLTQDSFSFNNNIQSVPNLLTQHIKDKLLPILIDVNFSRLLEVLHTKKVKHYNWIESFPSHKLKALSKTVDKTYEIIFNSNLHNEISNYENLYRNYLFLTPKMWDYQVNRTIMIIKDNWNILYSEYAITINELNKIDPIRIVGLENSFTENSKIILNIFHENKVSSGEWYLLSGDEYIDLEKLPLGNTSNLTVEIPKHWNYVSLMASELIVQNLPIIINKSVYYTLEGDIIPYEQKNKRLMKLKRKKSSLWFNEIIWDPESMALNIEIVGKQELDESYFVRAQDENIWKIEPELNFSKQYIDSLFMLESKFSTPFIVELQTVKDSLTATIEYIVLDTIPKSMGRLNDGGAWEETKINTIGSTNRISQNNYDSQLVPRHFVLYQNYPNPFNGQTKITFDLLEDAQVSLFITDAKGRVQEKILEEEFYNSGMYNFMWDAENHSSGVYFITLQAEVDQFPVAVFSRKMIYLK